MNKLECYQFPYASDNYAVLVHDSDSGQTACVDAGDAQAVLQALADKNWQLSHLLITHHHADHTAGLQQVKQKTGCKVLGPAPLSKDIKGLDVTLSDGEEFEFANRVVKAIHTPGHTQDMINFYFANDNLVFTGDTLFSMGCGRLFEGDAAMMHKSISKLAQLPDDTLVYCAHEYSTTNAKFALDVDPDNIALQDRAQQIQQLRASGEATVPTLLSLEKAINPFLRVNDAAIRAQLNLREADEVAVFAELRERRNQY